MTDKNLSVFENRYFYIIKFFMIFIGHWPFCSSRRNIVSQCFVFLSLSLFFITLIAGFIKVWGDAEKMIACLPTIFVTFCALIIIIIFHFKSKQFKEIFDKIKYDWEFWLSIEEQSIITKHANYGRLITLASTGSLFCAMSGYITMSVTSKIFNTDVFLNESRTKELPFQVYYFINYSKEHFYWVVLFFSFSFCLDAPIYISFESLFVCSIEHACGLFKIIGLRLKKINGNGTEMENLKAVYFCVEQHNRAIRYCENIESVFSLCLFFVVSFNCVFFSLSLIQVVSHIHELDVVVQFGVFLAASVTNICVYSIFSQRLLDHSTDLANIAYQISWEKLSGRVRKCLILVMIRSSVPCKITAGKMVFLSFKTASATLKASFSYFTLLTSTST